MQFSFKDGFKRARKAAGYTQQTFSDCFVNYDGGKVSLATVRNWEQGNSKPEYSTLKALCDFFKCDLDYLFANINCRSHDVQYICDMTGLDEQAVNILINLKKIQFNDEAETISFLLCDSAMRDKNHHYRSILNLLHFFLCYRGNSETKHIYLDGTILDTGTNISSIALNSRIIENAVLNEMQQALISLKELQK